MGEEFNSPEQKNNYVQRMFNNVSRRYDFLNHLLSAGIDRRWRKRAIEISRLLPGESFLDVACGTGDLASEAAKKKPSEVVALDFADKMLLRLVEKKKRFAIGDRIDPVEASAERLPFDDETFDVAGVAFGVRNFGNLVAGLSEIRRAVKDGGRVVILEFSKPHRFPVKQMYLFYFKRILPLIGRMVSGDRAAYSYLPDSVAAFPDGESFENILRETGFREVRSFPLTFGIATAYFGRR